MDAKTSLAQGSIEIIVRPNAKKTQIIGFDGQKGAFRVDISEPAEDNRANIEVIRFFSKLVGKRVEILKGLTSKSKVIRIGS